MINMKKGTENKRIDNLGLFLQIILLVAVIISMITSFFIGPLTIVTDSLITLLLLVLCYNNYTLYKRKYLTAIYFIVGIIWLVLTLVGVFNGI